MSASATHAVPYRGRFKDELIVALKRNGGFLGLWFVDAEDKPVTFAMLSYEEEKIILLDVKNKIYYSAFSCLRGNNAPDDNETWSRFLVTPPFPAKVSDYKRISLSDYLAVDPKHKS